MKILVIGGSGFIGSHVADSLSKKGHLVRIFDKKKSQWIKKNQKMFVGDILSSKLLEKIIRKSDIVYNFAALADIDIARHKPRETVSINILGTLRILDLCKKYKIKRFIQASSIYTNSPEGGFYAISKRSAEDYIMEFNNIYKLNYTILRFGSLYGERSDLNNGIRKLIENGIKKKKLLYRGGRYATRKYIHVKDAAMVCVEIIKKRYTNKCLTITGKKNTKILNLLNFFSMHLNIKKNKIKFLNEKNTGHYNIAPTKLKRKEGISLYIKKERNLKQSLIELMIKSKNQMKSNR